MPVTENPHGLDDFETMEDDPPFSDNAINDESDALDDLMDIFERLPTPPCQRPSTPPLTQPAAPKSPAPSRATPEDADVDVYPGAGKVSRKETTVFERANMDTKTTRTTPSKVSMIGKLRDGQSKRVPVLLHLIAFSSALQ